MVATSSNPITTEQLVHEIKRLKQTHNAIILAHYYQESEIQDVADFIGDSLALSQQAAKTDADVIVFCGVRFMADVAKIINPNKTVLLPDLAAGCSLEETCPADEFKQFKQQYPDHTVLTYINSSVAVKTLSDIIVTSANAEKIINQVPKDQPIIFAPDKYLGQYLIKKTGRPMVLWQGSCVVHENFSEKALINLTVQHPEAHVIAHPECPEHLLRYAKHIGSTSSLLNYVKQEKAQQYIVLTELGIIHQMQKSAPGCEFFDVPGLDEGACTLCNSCPYMRLNTLEKLYQCMQNQAPQIQLDPQLAIQAKQPIDRMLSLSA